MIIKKLPEFQSKEYIKYLIEEYNRRIDVHDDHSKNKGDAFTNNDFHHGCANAYIIVVEDLKRIVENKE